MRFARRLRQGWLWPGVLALALLVGGCFSQAQSGGSTSVEGGPAASMEDVPREDVEREASGGAQLESDETAEQEQTGISGP